MGLKSTDFGFNILANTTTSQIAAANIISLNIIRFIKPDIATISAEIAVATVHRNVEFFTCWIFNFDVIDGNPAS